MSLPSELDLSYLTPSEVRHIKEVLQRAEGNAEEETNDESESNRDSKHFNSDDFIRATWNEQHDNESKYVPGRAIVVAALPEPLPDEKVDQAATPTPTASPTASSTASPIASHESEAPDPVSKEILSDLVNQVNEESRAEASEPEHGVPDDARVGDDVGEVKEEEHEEAEKNEKAAEDGAGVVPVIVVEGEETEADDKENEPSKKRNKAVRKESWLMRKLKKVRRKSSEKYTEPKAEEATKSELVVDEDAALKQDGIDEVKEEEKSSSSSEEENEPSPKHESLEDDVIVSPLPADTDVVPDEPTSPKEGVNGELHLAVCFYPPDIAPHTHCPQKGTRLPDKENIDVMCRKEYVPLTGAKLPLLKGSESGAHPEADGELHIKIKEAKNLNLNSGIIRNKSRTYIKCYMLPDRFHASKMRSPVFKETSSPSYDHTFVFRGFSQKEFEDRSFEILICGLSFSMGKAVIVGGIRLRAQKPSDPKQTGTTKKSEFEVDVLKDAFLTPGEDVNARLAIRSEMKPTYQ